MSRAGADGPARGGHAVVLGASMAGLLAARVLAEHFEQVTIVERDPLVQDATPRRGVPQGRHIHVLLPRGARALDELFPGLLLELERDGVPVVDSLDQMHVELNDHVFFQVAGAPGVTRADGKLYEPSRPFLEERVLGRVRELPNVEILDGHDVVDLMADAPRARVTGVTTAPRGDGAPPRELYADLVVSAIGRSGRAVAWLRALGYAPPWEEELPVDLMYVSGRVRFPEGSVERRLAVLVGCTPDRPKGCWAVAQEGGSWVVTAVGYGGDHHPPKDRAGWLDFVADIAPRDFTMALRAAEPLDNLVQHRFPASLRRRYDKLRSFPEGLLVVGDAVCSLNPVHGQGMTVAALEALALRESLQGGPEDLTRRFFRASARPVGDAWRFAVRADLVLPDSVVPGSRPVPVRAANAYVNRFQAAAEADPVMAWRFLDVTGFEEPAAALFSPDSLRRVAADRRNHREPALLPGF